MQKQIIIDDYLINTKLLTMLMNGACYHESI